MKQWKILVVGEKATCREIASRLEALGAEIATVSGEKEAVSRVRLDVYDLIIIKNHSEQQLGIELMQKLRSMEDQTPLLLIDDPLPPEFCTDVVQLGALNCRIAFGTGESLLDIARQVLTSRRVGQERERRLTHLETLINSLHDGLITIDRTLQVQTCNRTAEQGCALIAPGVAVEDGEKTCADGCFALLRDVFVTGKPRTRQHVRCDGYGRKRLLTLCAAPLVGKGADRDGAILQIREEEQEGEAARPNCMQLGGIVGKSLRMQEIYSLIDVLAEVDTTVLITGESGTGKELVAEALHHCGSRKDKPLVKVNCAALSENLLESELFGHVKGAFTGAFADKVGRFQRAHGGTIFLDEIGDVSPAVQLKLLRVLQEKEFERVGDSLPIKVNVRILTATNQDLLQKVRQGRFREDLFYRLKVVNVDLPPLRRRKEDIPMLMEHFRLRFNQQHGRNILRFAEDILPAFLRYDWPGNVRELQHAVEHSAIMCKSETIVGNCLPPELRTLLSGSRHIRRDEVNQAESLRHALEKAGGNKAKAARLLGVSRQTLYRKLAENGFESDGDQAELDSEGTSDF